MKGGERAILNLNFMNFTKFKVNNEKSSNLEKTSPKEIERQIPTH